MDALTLLKTRRSAPIKMMTEPGPTDAQLDAMLAVAMRTPDHGKLAPWRFIVVPASARARFGAALAEIYAAENPDASAKRLDEERTRPLRGPALVVAVAKLVPDHPKIPEWEQILSGGAACQNLCIAAGAMGFRASWLTEWPAYSAGVRSLLGLDETDRILGFIYVGSTASPVEDRARPDFDAVVSRWG